MISFDWPWAFVLLPLPLLAYYLLPRAESQDVALKAPFIARLGLAQHGLTSASLSSLNIAVGGFILAWALLVCSLARPQYLGEPIALPTSGRDLMVAVDTSGSMETADMQVNNRRYARLDIVKGLLGDFLKRRKGDRVGLILFGTNAYLQTPLTFDLNTVNDFLQETTIGIAGEKTAIGDAIGLAVKRLKDRPENQRVLILLTDGENTAGNVAPRQAADLAKQADVKIYTIGMGADSMEMQSGFFGNFTRTVNPSKDLDEPTLIYIAETTGGQYYRARNPQELLEIYQNLDEIEAIDQDEQYYQPTRSLYMYPLAASLILSFLAHCISLIQINRLRSDNTAHNKGGLRG